MSLGRLRKALADSCVQWGLFVLWDKVSLYSPSSPRTHYIDQVDLEFPCLCLPSARIKGMYRHAGFSQRGPGNVLQELSQEDREKGGRKWRMPCSKIQPLDMWLDSRSRKSHDLGLAFSLSQLEMERGCHMWPPLDPSLWTPWITPHHLPVCRTCVRSAQLADLQNAS